MKRGEKREVPPIFTPFSSKPKTGLCAKEAWKGKEEKRKKGKGSSHFFQFLQEPEESRSSVPEGGRKKKKRGNHLQQPKGNRTNLRISPFNEKYDSPSLPS